MLNVLGNYVQELTFKYFFLQRGLFTALFDICKMNREEKSLVHHIFDLFTAILADENKDDVKYCDSTQIGFIFEILDENLRFSAFCLKKMKEKLLQQQNTTNSNNVNVDTTKQSICQY